MSAPYDGGPAFPCQPRDPQGAPCAPMEYGMTLRDWFAGMALPSVYKEGVGEITEEEMASDCYRIADAMIAASTKEEA